MSRSKYLDTRVLSHNQLIRESLAWNPLLNTNLTAIAHSIGRDRGFYDDLLHDQMTPVADLAFDKHIYMQLAHIASEINEYLEDETDNEALELADVVILACDLSAIFGYEIWSADITPCSEKDHDFFSDMQGHHARMCSSYRKTGTISQELFIGLCKEADYCAQLGKVPLLDAFYDKCRINLKRGIRYGLKQS